MNEENTNIELNKKIDKIISLLESIKSIKDTELTEQNEKLTKFEKVEGLLNSIKEQNENIKELINQNKVIIGTLMNIEAGQLRSNIRTR